MSKQKLKWTKQCKCGYYIPDEYDRCDKCLLKDFNEQLETPITIDALGGYLYLEEEVVKALRKALRNEGYEYCTVQLNTVTRFFIENAMKKTINWYTDNRWWWEPLKSGEYLAYYRTHYKQEL